MRRSRAYAAAATTWLAASLALALIAAPAHAERRIALVVGNEDYPREVGRLSHPHEDAALIANALRSLEFELVTGGIVRDADQAELNAAVLAFQNALAEEGAGAVGFFYYSGHGGSTDVRGKRRNYLIPARSPITRADQLPFLGVDLGGVIDALAGTHAKAVFIVSDACRNTLPWTSNMGGAQPDRGFVAEPDRTGLFIAHATAEGETAPDDGVFAAKLAERLTTPGVYAPRAFALAFREVADARDAYRRPTVSDQLRADICFRSCPGEEKPFDLDPRAAELAAIEGWTRCEEARTYFADASGRLYSGYARTREAELCAPETLPVGATFREDLASGGQGPEMVVIPEGSFVMGSPASQADRGSDEGPRGTVRLGSLAVGRFEVTRGEYAAFIAATGYGGGDGCYVDNGSAWEMDEARSWREPGFAQSDDHPVACVSWEDAQAYVRWLSHETRQSYRLLTEAEWEYAARAGTTGRFSNELGEADLCTIANHADRSTSFSWKNATCSDGVGERTAPVGSFVANGFGLFDMHGNVHEWVEDCYQDSYSGGSRDGSAALIRGCDRRVVRGGSWYDPPGYQRSAARDGYSSTIQLNYLGFRLARTF